ncbi:MAG: Arc family DNA-binding protein [Pseudomonadota bacterium]|nr:Arc family DNA-binding protein [Pseudomonadota bacterium]
MPWLFAHKVEVAQTEIIMVHRRPTPLQLRIPAGVRAALEDLAKANNRSAQAELAAILEAAIDRNKNHGTLSADALLCEVVRAVGSDPLKDVVAPATQAPTESGKKVG